MSGPGARLVELFCCLAEQGGLFFHAPPSAPADADAADVSVPARREDSTQSVGWTGSPRAQADSSSPPCPPAEPPAAMPPHSLPDTDSDAAGRPGPAQGDPAAHTPQEDPPPAAPPAAAAPAPPGAGSNASSPSAGPSSAPSSGRGPPRQPPEMLPPRPGVDHESVFRSLFLPIPDGPEDDLDDMLWFVRNPQPPAQPASLGRRRGKEGAEPVYLRRRTNPALLPPCQSPAVDWPRTLALNAAAQWPYILRVSICRDPNVGTKPPPGRMTALRYVERKVYAAPTSTDKSRKDAVYEISYPQLFFTVEDFDEAFGNMSLSRGQEWVVELAAMVGEGEQQKTIRIFQGMVPYSRLESAFQVRSQHKRSFKLALPGRAAEKEKEVQYINMRGPGGRGAAQAAVSAVPPEEAALSSPLACGSPTQSSEPQQQMAPPWLTLRVCLTFVCCRWEDVIERIEKAILGGVPGDGWVIRVGSDEQVAAEWRTYHADRERELEAMAARRASTAAEEADSPPLSPRAAAARAKAAGAGLLASAQERLSSLKARAEGPAERRRSAPEEPQPGAEADGPMPPPATDSPPQPPAQAPPAEQRGRALGGYMSQLRQAAASGFGLRKPADAAAAAAADPAWPPSLPPFGSMVEACDLQKESWRPLNGQRGVVVAAHGGGDAVIVEFPQPHGRVALAAANCSVVCSPPEGSGPGEPPGARTSPPPDGPPSGGGGQLV